MTEKVFEAPQPTESKPTNWPKIVLAAVLGFGLLSGAAFAGYWYGTKQIQLFEEATPVSPPTIPAIEDKFTEIEECILGVKVDFISGRDVENKEDVEIVFNEYIRDSKANNREIFGLDYGNEWRFESATIHGLYEGVKYWKVVASWFSEAGGGWRTITVYDVSENGEVVRLLGCI